MLWQIIHIIEILLWLLLAASGAYILFFALVSMLWKKPVSPLTKYLSGQMDALRTKQYYRFLVLYPAYNEDRVIVNSVQTFLGQYYPYQNFHVCVISDHMTDETNKTLAELPITLLQPFFEKSSKAKAMQYAMDILEGDYDFVVILDADNVVDIDFLQKLNDVCAKGYKAIQCHRCAKNSNNDIAVLDGVSEEINNTIFRKAHNRIGLSSALIGSGMCFDFNWFRENVFKLTTAGEDRELEALLLKQKVHIRYEPDIHAHSSLHAYRADLHALAADDNHLPRVVHQMVAVVSVHLCFALCVYPPSVAQPQRLWQDTLPAHPGLEDALEHSEDRPQEYGLHPYHTRQIGHGRTGT